MSRTTYILSALTIAFSTASFAVSVGKHQAVEAKFVQKVSSQFKGGFEEWAYYQNPMSDPKSSCCTLNYKQAKKLPNFKVVYPNF